MPATLRDVAAACGVNISTVSRALRNDSRIAEGTRKKVAETAVALGYQPNTAARSLAGAKNRTVWILTPTLKSGYEHILITECCEQLIQRNYTPLVSLYTSPDVYEMQLRQLQQGLTDGAIILPNYMHAGHKELNLLAEKKFPIVFMDRHPEFSGHATVTSDNEKGAEELVRRLVEGGADSFVMIFNENANAVEKRRLQSALKTIGKYGLPFAFIADPLQAVSQVAGLKTGVLATTQRTIELFIKSNPELKEKTSLRFACFDNWSGDPYPAEKTIVCIQDFPQMGKEASGLILALIKKDRIEEKMKLIAPAEFRAFSSQVN